MNKVIVEIFSHSGTSLFNGELNFTFLPRVGETISINKNLDGTDIFIVLDVTYFLEDNIMKPYLHCESFYPLSKGAYTRLYYLRQGCWIEGHCDETSRD